MARRRKRGRGEARPLRPLPTDGTAPGRNGEADSGVPRTVFGVVKEVRGNAIWDVLKYGLGALLSGGLAFLRSSSALWLAPILAIALTFWIGRPANGWRVCSRLRLVAVFGLAAAGGFVATWLAQRYLVPVDGPSSQFGVLIVKQISLTNLPVEGNLVRVEVAFTKPGTAVLRNVKQSTLVEFSEAGPFRPDFELMLGKLGSQQGSDLPPNGEKSMQTPIPVQGSSMGEPQSLGFVDATKIRKGVRKIGAAGVFRYLDGQGADRETRYCAVYNAVKHPFFDECPDNNWTR